MCLKKFQILQKFNKIFQMYQVDFLQYQIFKSNNLVICHTINLYLKVCSRELIDSKNFFSPALHNNYVENKSCGLKFS